MADLCAELAYRLIERSRVVPEWAVACVLEDDAARPRQVFLEPSANLVGNDAPRPVDEQGREIELGQ